jgi:cytochrome c551/c552
MARKLALGTLMLLAGLLVNGAGTSAAELLMFDDPGCVWCRRWNAEIGPSYPRTAEGQQAPLRRIHIRDQGKAGVALARPVNATPTFVLVDEGQEVGRIAGYPGSDYFYPMLEELLRRIPSPTPLPGQAERSTMCASTVCRP